MIGRGALALLLACAVATADAQTPGVEPTRTVAMHGTAEVAFAPWSDPEALLLQAIDDARDSIHVQAYLFTSKALARGLIAARRRGLRVEVLLDAEMNRPGSLSVLPELLEAGVPVAMLTRFNIAHNKVMLFDAGSPHAAVATGSYNYTRSARLSNAENLLILRGNPALVRLYLDTWQRQRAEAVPLRSLDDLPARKDKRDGRESDRTTVD